MDIAIHRPRTACARSGRQFVAGEPFFSALVRSQGSLERLDFADSAWSGPPDNTLAWWRSTYLATTSSGAALAPVDVLLDVVEELGGDGDAALRYLVSLELVRRRVLRFVDHPGPPVGEEPSPGDPDASQHVVLACGGGTSAFGVMQVLVLGVQRLAHPRPCVEARLDIAQRPPALAGLGCAHIAAGVGGHA